MKLMKEKNIKLIEMAPRKNQLPNDFWIELITIVFHLLNIPSCNMMLNITLCKKIIKKDFDVISF